MQIRLCFVVMAVLFSVSAFAQVSTRFIEVIESDSIWAEPASAVYEISFGGADSRNIMNMFGLPGDDTISQSVVSGIEAQLVAGNFRIRKTEKDFSVAKGSGKKSIQIDITSKAELERLYNWVKTQSGLSGKIVSVYADRDKLNNALYQKLYAQAKARAAILAKYAEGQPGKLISATEMADTVGDSYESVKELWKNMAPGLLNTDTGYNLVYQKKIQFRFELK